MKKTEGKRTSVAEYVRKRACGESAGPGKKEVLPDCEKSAQQEEVKSTSWKCSGKRAVAM